MIVVKFFTDKNDLWEIITDVVPQLNCGVWINGKNYLITSIAYSYRRRLWMHQCYAGVLVREI